MHSHLSKIFKKIMLTLKFYFTNQKVLNYDKKITSFKKKSHQGSLYCF